MKHKSSHHKRATVRVKRYPVFTEESPPKKKKKKEEEEEKDKVERTEEEENRQAETLAVQTSRAIAMPENEDL